jgi:hypothetical protein
MERPTRRLRAGALIATMSAVALLASGVGSALAAGVPEVTPLGAAPRTMESARLNARVDPNDLPTTYQFEYGAGQSYGATVPAVAAPAGEGSIAVLVSAEIDGLQPASTYHFRVVATNSAGTVVGDDATFRTRSLAEATPQDRGIELVNPPDKGEQNVQKPVYQALAMTTFGDSNHMLWALGAGAPGANTGTGNAFLSTRTPDGWVSRSVVPPADRLIGGGSSRYDLLKASNDFSRFLFQVNEGLGPTPFDYVRGEFDASGLPDATTLYSYPDLVNQDEARAHILGDGTLTRVITSETDDGHIYEIGSGALRMVDVLPGGEPSPCGGGDVQNDRRTLSDNGKSAFFSAQPTLPCGSSQPQLYRRDLDLKTTELISEPFAGVAQQSEVVAVAADGLAAVQLTASTLTAEDANSVSDLYMWVHGEGNRCLTCEATNATGKGVFADPRRTSGAFVSSDFSHVYFESRGRLIPGVGSENGTGPQGATLTNLYVWDEQDIRFVGTVAASGSGPQLSQAGTAISDDGEVFAFVSIVPPTTDPQNECVTEGFTEVHPCLQAYRFEAASNSLECVSCSTDGITDGEIYTGQRINQILRMSADGRTVAFQTKAALLSEDVNGTGDAYVWHDGTLALITDGETIFGPADSQPVVWSIDDSGANIYFSVAGQLTRFEDDALANLYDARIGGGFSPPAPPAHCAEDSCQGPLTPAPGVSPPGSANFVGPGNPAPRLQKHKRNRRHQAHRKKKRKRGKRMAAHHNHIHNRAEAGR